MQQQVTPPWQYDDPLCAQVGGTFFFARDRDEELLSSSSDSTYVDAKKICKQCKHLVECAVWGLKNEEFGVWGGLSPADRKSINQRRKPFPYKKTA